MHGPAADIHQTLDFRADHQHEFCMFEIPIHSLQPLHGCWLRLLTSLCLPGIPFSRSSLLTFQRLTGAVATARHQWTAFLKHWAGAHHQCRIHCR